MVTLRKAKIVETWASLLVHCQGEAEGFFRMVEEELRALEPPGVTWKRESAAPGFWKGLAGKRREFLLLRNERFRDVMMGVGARDYGASLDVSWYLLESTRSLIKRLLVRIPWVGLLLIVSRQVKDFDVFDQQDLRAYATVGHYAVKASVEKIVEKRGLDLAIDWKSKGPLGIS